MTSRVKEVGEYVDQYGKPEAVAHFDLSPETIKRYYTTYQQETGKIIEQTQENVLVKKLFDRFTPKELRAIADGKSMDRNQLSNPIINLEGDEVRIGFVTDTHMGSKYFHEAMWDAFLEQCEAHNVDMIMHSGDLVEGMSNRPDQVYSLTHIGMSAQMDYAEELLSRTNIPIKIVDGNHDRWGIKSSGIFAVKDVARRLKHVDFLGHDTGIVKINGTDWKLWHGEDGSSYATSYRIQKVIEAFTGGQKPHVLLCGHTHKQAYIFDRNIHAVSGGSLCYQSAWMQSKRLPNHTGFHIIKAGIADNEIKWFEPRWYPIYQ